jgi:hypothetical protein
MRPGLGITWDKSMCQLLLLKKKFLKVVNDHWHVLNIVDTQEMMVGIAYAMSFKLQQFDLFHV